MCGVMCETLAAINNLWSACILCSKSIASNPADIGTKTFMTTFRTGPCFLLQDAHGWQTHPLLCLPAMSISYSCARYSLQDYNILTCAALYFWLIFPEIRKKDTQEYEMKHVNVLQGECQFNRNSEA